MMIKKMAIGVSVIGLLLLGVVFIYGANKGHLTYALHFKNDEGTTNILYQKLTSIDPPNSISFDLNNEMFSSELLITLKEVSEGTKMTVKMDTEGSNSLYNAFIHLGKENLDQNQRQNYEAFKQLLEQE